MRLSKIGKPLSSFMPGQFLPLKLDIPGQYKPVYRTYSISDSPNKDYYRLTIKRELAPPDRSDLYPGVSSNYFHDQVQPETKLLAKPPRGKFFLDPKAEGPVVLLSAGVGLTPLVSMLNAIVDSGSRRLVWFIHGARNSREHALGEHLRRVAEEHDNVSVHIRYSKPLPEDVSGRDYDYQGHVDLELLKLLLPNNDFDFYVCGPTPFMKSLFNGLLEWGVPEYRIHYEFFGPASALKDRSKISTRKTAAAVSECCGEIEVTFSRSGVRANWNSSLESILDLAEANGLSPDYSCRSGICHTCMCKLEDGEVEYLEEPLDPLDPGYVLICCSKPRTNVVVDV
jgi:ferredoxin-NADP reductase